MKLSLYISFIISDKFIPLWTFYECFDIKSKICIELLLFCPKCVHCCMLRFFATFIGNTFLAASSSGGLQPKNKTEILCQKMLKFASLFVVSIKFWHSKCQLDKLSFERTLSVESLGLALRGKFGFCIYARIKIWFVAAMS